MTEPAAPEIEPIGPPLQPITEELRDLEIDQFQRYVAVAALLGAMHREPGIARVLDLGSGPNATLRRFLPEDRFVVQRADVQDFSGGEPGFLRLEAGRPIPAADGAFEFVTALDVLEHVPPGARQAWLAEIARVAGRGMIVTAPNGVPEVARCERLIDAAFARQNGSPHPFLVEHFGYGLPTEQEVRPALATTTKQLTIYAIHPLHQWVASLMFMQRLLTVHGGQAACAALNRLQNREVRFWPRTMLCYRKIYVGTSSPDLTARLPGGALSAGEDAAALAGDPLEQLARYAAENSQQECLAHTATGEREDYWRKNSLALHDRLGHTIVDFERASAERDAGREELGRLVAALHDSEAKRSSAEALARSLQEDLAAISTAFGTAAPADRATLVRLATVLQHRLAAQLRDSTLRCVRLRRRQLDAPDRALIERFLPSERPAK